MGCDSPFSASFYSEAEEPRRGLFDDAHSKDDVLGQLAGYASLCWEPKPEGEFNSAKAVEAVKAAADRLTELGYWQ